MMKKPNPRATRVGVHWVWFEAEDDGSTSWVRGYIDGKLDYSNGVSRFRYALSAGDRWKKRTIERLARRESVGLKHQQPTKESIMYQKLIVVGNLGKDPELRYAPNGDAVCGFNMATNRKYTDRGGQLVKETTWFRISVWGKQAETCNQYLKKGSSVLVEGRLQADKETGGPRTYQKQDGTTGTQFEITAETVRFLSTGQGEGQTRTEESPEDAL